MFDLVTGNKRVVQVVLAIIILPFAFFGIDSYFRGNSEATEIVNINGESVSVNEFGQLLRSVQSSMQSQLKDNPEMQTYFNSDEFKNYIIPLRSHQSADTHAFTSCSLRSQRNNVPLHDACHGVPTGA